MSETHDPRMVSEREAVLRERKAFVRGVCYNVSERTATGIAASMFPLTPIVQPRVVTDADGDHWKIDGGLRFRTRCGDEWIAPPASAFDAVNWPVSSVAINDVWKNPTETIPDPGGSK